MDGRGHITMEWMVNTFKPYIDAEFPTLPDRAHTFIAGSSMGGLMSLYAVTAYNHVFSRAAALSPSIWFATGRLDRLLRTAHMEADTVVYMDYGSRELSFHSNMKRQFSRVAARLLERIFLYLCNVSSEIVSFTAISKELGGVSRPTVENYINYLESANLVYQSWPVEMGGRKVLKAQPKIYIADAAIRNTVLMDDDILTNPIELGKMVETAVYKHVAAFYYQQATRVGFYRGGRKNKEIDVVVDYPKTA